jgi:hypothetical protein
MNNEISFLFQPSYIAGKFEKLTEDDFKEIDSLARLMVNPDSNFDVLCEIWNTNKKYRILNSPWLGIGIIVQKDKAAQMSHKGSYTKGGLNILENILIKNEKTYNIYL